MRFEIKNRWTGSVIFECEAGSLKAAVEEAVETKVSLRYSDLSGSDLSDSDLSGSDLSGSDLSDSNLSGSDLRYSNLSDSNLSGSDLSGSNLRYSDLSGSNLSPIKNDFFAVLLATKNEIPGLRQALIDGKVDGSTYSAECACLVGTIANVRHCNYKEIPNLKPDSGRPIECFFTAIKPGETPDKNAAAKKAVEWIDEFQMLLNAKQPLKKGYMTETKMNLLQANALVKKCDGLFRSAAVAWTRGNNSGKSDQMVRGENQCYKYRAQAEEMLKPLGITVDYSGLYPSFNVDGYDYHSTESAVSAALESEHGIAASSTAGSRALVSAIHRGKAVTA